MADADFELMEYSDFTLFVHTTAAAENEWTTQEKYTIFHRLEKAHGTVFTKPDALNPYVWIQYDTFALAESRALELAKLKLNNTIVTARLNKLGNTSGCRLLLLWNHYPTMNGLLVFL